MHAAAYYTFGGSLIVHAAGGDTMLVFGGWTTSSLLANEDVWRLDLSGTEACWNLMEGAEGEVTTHPADSLVTTMLIFPLFLTLMMILSVFNAGPGSGTPADIMPCVTALCPLSHPNGTPQTSRPLLFISCWYSNCLFLSGFER